MKPYIIQRLNADYPKPWFPKKLNGEQPAEGYCELWDMTYYEIALRLVEVLYHPHIEVWCVALVHVGFKQGFVRILKQIIAENSR